MRFPTKDLVPVVRSVSRGHHNKSDLESHLTEKLLKVLPKFDSLPPNEVKAIAYRIAKNEYIDHYNRDKCRHKAEEVFRQASELFKSTPLDPETNLQLKEFRGIVIKWAKGQDHDTQRFVDAFLSEENNQSPPQTLQSLGVNRVKWYKMRDKLARHLKQVGYERP